MEIFCAAHNTRQEDATMRMQIEFTSDRGGLVARVMGTGLVKITKTTAVLPGDEASVRHYIEGFFCNWNEAHPAQPPQVETQVDVFIDAWREHMSKQ